MSRWQISIDVGGTFTDCLASGPDGRPRVVKVLSEDRSDPSGETAPIRAIRQALALRPEEAIPPVDVRLGTTRGTNALLSGGGGRTALVTTRGFRDLLAIGLQSRPGLFDLTIRKRTPLYDRVVEVDERTLADGTIRSAPDRSEVERELRELRRDGVDGIAIALLHSWTEPANERIIEQIARAVGFDHVVCSSTVSPLIRLVPRGNSALLDAWLEPVLRDYIDRVARELGEGSTLRLMTSGGGLVGRDRFSGRDSILSGPAGGVIGYAQITAREGARAAIGFDMGGTSTDVSRFAGRLEREYESEKGGVPIFSPTLAIETVAAGGGSVCGFDGVRLLVGPQSAGADPGPACYGRGGPLTVTDMNFCLGRILPDRFPFRLDRDAVNRLLDERRAEIASSPLGADLTREELAEGYLRIANERMVRAIRSISVARGYDPADHVLIPFGGAAGQHACSIATQLGIRTVVLHPHAGILSARGIACADVRSVREQSVLRRLTEIDREDLDRLFSSLEQRALADIEGEGIGRERQDPPQRSLALRYEGLERSIAVDEPGETGWRVAYEREFERLYGYSRRGRPIEIVTARVEVVGRTEPPEQPVATTACSGRPRSESRRPVWFDGAPCEVPIYAREALQPGHLLIGPAVISEATSTIVLSPGWEAEVTRHDEIVLTDRGEQTVSDAHSSTGAPDPVMLEVFNNLFASIAEQMGERLRQTATSTNVRERLDYSCALFSPDGSLVANAPHIPVHLGAMGETVRMVIEDAGEMKAGDVYVTNDPYRGGSHLPDVTVVTPVFDRDEAELLFLTASRAHHAEIGGITPGSMPPFSRNLEEEGVLIRTMKLVDAGESREEEVAELLRSAAYPSRDPETNLADLRAQVAANRRGAELVHGLVERYSTPVVHDYMERVRRAAAEKMRLVLRDLDDRTYRATDYLDDGSPIAVAVTLSGETARIDFSGTGRVLPTNLNANRAITTAAVLYVLRCMIGEDIPLNAGVLDPVEIVIPESLLNPPVGPDAAGSPAVVGGNVETSQRIVDVLLTAFGLAACSQGTMNNVTFGGESFGYYETICGGSGATSEGPGADAVHTHMTNTRLTDIEVLEHRYPVRVNRFEIRKGSGGIGDHDGGNGVVREIEFLAPLGLAILSQRRGGNRPAGLAGGQAGAAGENRLIRADGEEIDIGSSGRYDVDRGDRLVVMTPGGGGWGGRRTGIAEPGTGDQFI